MNLGYTNRLRIKELIETMNNHLRKMLKVDDHISSLEMGKFARVCIEVDLSQPLK